MHWMSAHRVGLGVAFLAALVGGCSKDTPKRGRPEGKARAPAPVQQGPEPTLAERMYGGSDQTRIGDAGLPVIDEPSDAYPQRRHWAQAGVEGGIGDPGPVVAELAEGDDIQAAIQSVASGVVQLAAGRYALSEPLAMKSGVVLRGEPGRTVLLFGRRGPVAGVRFDGVHGGALEGVTLRYADPEALADAPHHQRGRYASSPDFEPGGPAAIEVHRSDNCWMQDVTVESAHDAPLSIRDSRHCTIRRVTFDGTLNRGTTAGAVRVADSEYLLLAGLRARGVRMIRFQGPTQWCVLRSSVLGCTVYLAEADRVRGLLIEDVHFLFEPGYPLGPIAKGHMPAGPDSRLVNCTTVYHHGTDALAGQLIEPRRVYAVNRYGERTQLSLSDGSVTASRLVSPLQVTKVLAAGPTGRRRPVDIPAAWDQRPPNVPVMTLRDRAVVDDWVWTGPVSASMDQLDVASLVSPPLQPGQSRQIAGKAVDVGLTPAAAGRPRRKPNPAHVQQMVGRFGRRALPPPGGEVHLLGRAGGDWQAGIVLQRVVHVPGRPVISYDAKTVGLGLRVFIGKTELAEKRLYRLQPGWHAVTVLAQLDKAMPLVTKAVLGLRFSLHDPPEAATVVRAAPRPEAGYLYPYRPAVDPLAGERAALAAWGDYFEQLRTIPFPDRIGRTRELIDTHAGTHVAWVARRIADIFEKAPHREQDELTRQQWGRLADYYQKQGLVERTWQIQKIKKPGTYREYYPGMEVER